MHAHARDHPYGSAPVLAHASAARHGKTGGPSGEGELSFTRPFPDGPAGEGKFDFGRRSRSTSAGPLPSRTGCASAGTPRCTADVVTAELARPGRERSAIGRLAAGLLETAGWRP